MWDMALWRRSARPRASRGLAAWHSPPAAHNQPGHAAWHSPPAAQPCHRCHAGRPQRHSRITESFGGKQGESRRVKPAWEAAGVHEGGRVGASWEQIGYVWEEARAAGGEWAAGGLDVTRRMGGGMGVEEAYRDG